MLLQAEKSTANNSINVHVIVSFFIVLSLFTYRYGYNFVIGSTADFSYKSD
uniref:Uncharacterized protein n=1 Tax=uncultured bacterium contig00061 TaxID=1181544 RepID=A0A806KKS4_9BACT|nr:hypothetical protein [uncultured bacterium contig00061]